MRFSKNYQSSVCTKGLQNWQPSNISYTQKSVPCSKFSNFDATKTLRADSFAASWCTRMTSTFLGTSKLISNGVREPRSLQHVECPPDSLENCWFTYLITNKKCMGCRFHPVYVYGCFVFAAKLETTQLDVPFIVH